MIMTNFVFPDAFRCATIINDNAKCPRITLSSSMELMPALSPMKPSDTSNRRKRIASIKLSVKRYETEIKKLQTKADKNVAAVAPPVQVKSSPPLQVKSSPPSQLKSGPGRKESLNPQQQHHNQYIASDSKPPSNPLVITPLRRGPRRERKTSPSNTPYKESNNSPKGIQHQRIKRTNSTSPPQVPQRQESNAIGTRCQSESPKSSTSRGRHRTSPSPPPLPRRHESNPMGTRTQSESSPLRSRNLIRTHTRGDMSPPLPKRKESIVAYGSVVLDIKQMGKLSLEPSIDELEPPSLPQRKTSLLYALKEREASLGNTELDLDFLNEPLLSRVTEVDEFHDSFMNPPSMPKRQLSLLHDSSELFPEE